MRAEQTHFRHRLRASAAGRTAPGVRRGAVMVLVLVCLLGVSLLTATVLRLAVAQQRQLEMELRHLQAEWLAEAALERAAAMLRRDPTWQGDEWSLSADLIAEGGVVETHLEPVSGPAGGWRVAVTASVPAGDPRRARVTRRLLLAGRAADSAEDRP